MFLACTGIKLLLLSIEAHLRDKPPGSEQPSAGKLCVLAHSVKNAALSNHVGEKKPPNKQNLNIYMYSRGLQESRDPGG